MEIPLRKLDMEIPLRKLDMEILFPKLDMEILFRKFNQYHRKLTLFEGILTRISNSYLVQNTV